MLCSVAYLYLRRLFSDAVLARCTLFLDLVGGDVSVSCGIIGITSGHCSQVASFRIANKQVRRIFRKSMRRKTDLNLTPGHAMAKHREKTVTGRLLHDPVKDKLLPMFPLHLSKC